MKLDVSRRKFLKIVSTLTAATGFGLVKAKDLVPATTPAKVPTRELVEKLGGGVIKLYSGTPGHRKSKCLVTIAMEPFEREEPASVKSRGQGTTMETGEARYFKLYSDNDRERVLARGRVGMYGTELVMANTNLVEESTVTIDTFRISMG